MNEINKFFDDTPINFGSDINDIIILDDSDIIGGISSINEDVWNISSPGFTMFLQPDPILYPSSGGGDAIPLFNYILRDEFDNIIDSGSQDVYIEFGPGDYSLSILGTINQDITYLGEIRSVVPESSDYGIFLSLIILIYIWINKIL